MSIHRVGLERLGQRFMTAEKAIDDLANLLGILVLPVSQSVQLLRYATPVIYPVSSIPERFQWIILANPLTPIVEAFRYAFLGSLIFNQVEQTFMDTV